VLWIAPAGYPYALDSRRCDDTLGIPAEKLSVADLVVRYPQIDFEDDAWGVLEPQSGVLLARRAVHAVVERAEKLGVDFTVGEVNRRKRTAPERSNDDERRPDFRGNLRVRVRAMARESFPHLLASRIFPSVLRFLFGVPAGSTQFREGTLPTWLYLKDEFYGMPTLKAVDSKSRTTGMARPLIRIAITTGKRRDAHCGARISCTAIPCPCERAGN